MHRLRQEQLFEQTPLNFLPLDKESNQGLLKQQNCHIFFFWEKGRTEEQKRIWNKFQKEKIYIKIQVNKFNLDIYSMNGERGGGENDFLSAISKE